ncbi:MAG: hypothetical protein N2595_08285 [bacterium]|nr:hypothetical protein [bacterium]
MVSDVPRVFDACGAVCYNGGMIRLSSQRRLLVLRMEVARSVTESLWEAIWAKGRDMYRSVWVLGGKDVLVAGGQWRRVKSVRGLVAAGPVAVPEVTLAELDRCGEAFAGALRAHPTDVLVCGGAEALRAAARLAVWARVTAPATRWVAVPCCLWNGVPFTVCALGYASGLRWCAQQVRALMRGREGGVPTVTIRDDSYGWLRLGLVALFGTPKGSGDLSVELRLETSLPCAPFDRRLGRALGAAVMRRVRYAAPGIMLTVRLRAGTVTPIIDHLALTESMYATRAIPSLYVSKTSGNPTELMKTLVRQWCAPWREVGGKRARERRDGENVGRRGRLLTVEQLDGGTA